MKVVDKKISLEEINKLARDTFGNLVKAVVDVEKEIMVVGGQLHSDEESLLIEHGSKQENIWGINIYPQESSDNWIEFDSMINLRPYQENLTRSVDNSEICQKIVEIVNQLVEK